jgi:hypothetical protein
MDGDRSRECDGRVSGEGLPRATIGEPGARADPDPIEPHRAKKEGRDVAEVGDKGGQRAGGWPIVSRLIRWRHYDVTFGLIMPVVCFALEFVLLPALGWLPGLIFFHRYRLFGYGVVALELAVLTVWLRSGDRLGRWSAALAGVLLAGSLFAGVLGLLLFPFAVPGVLVLGIGLFGFVPLFTAHVYYLNGIAAYRQAEAHLGKQRLLEALLWGGVLVYGIPGLVQARVSLVTRAALREVIEGDDRTARTAVARLRPYWWVADFDPLRRAYVREGDPNRRARLERDYRELTGNDVRQGPDRLFEYDGPERIIGV